MNTDKPRTMLKNITSYLDSLLKLAFPDLCVACQHEQPVKGDLLCVQCESAMPYCKFPSLTDNLIHWRIGGRLLPEWCSSLIYFKSGGTSQAILHALKYRGRQDIGESLGRRHGEVIRNGLEIPPPDYILPVPLHPKRLHERGYNQSAAYARGLSEPLGSPVAEDLLIRNRYTETQTNKSKADRITNVSDAFALGPGASLEGKSVLIVDDVFTSGATMEACAAPLIHIPDIRISIATLAIADDW